MIVGRSPGYCGGTGIEALLSEARDECTTYAKWRPPKSDALETLKLRLRADYYQGGEVVAIVLHSHRNRDSTDGDFGKIYGDVQVHLVASHYLLALLVEHEEAGIFISGKSFESKILKKGIRIRPSTQIIGDGFKFWVRAT